MKKHLLLIILIVATLVVHFAYYGHPNETVFDEVHFGKFISGYFTHQYFFDIHPPLGKLLISGVGYLTGFKPGFSYAEIGQKFPDNSYLWLRLLPTLAGVLLPIIIFFLALRLGISKFGSFAAGMFVTLESSLLVQSRFILLDSFLLLFGFSALLAYFKYHQEKKINYLYLAGILGALSMSVKWTGASFLGLIFILEAINIIRTLKERKLLVSIGNILAAVVVVPVVIYFSIFAVHLKLLTKSGPGDAFMTPSFQKNLVGSVYAQNPNVKPIGLIGEFVELNIEMYRANATLTATHPYQSAWYTWPFMTRPIYYWFHDNFNGMASRIYLIGNPLIWWLSSVAIFYGLLMWGWKLILGLFKKFIGSPFPLLIAGGYLFNLLPFIGITRAMFLYHYMSALIFAILALVFIIDRFKFNKAILTTIIVLSAIVFLFFAPIIYGLPLTTKAYNARVWFSSWE
ncbi:MAG: phospholipid carrier-dependent glycosyltransferase [Minisyncoccia bacterium]